MDSLDAKFIDKQLEVRDYVILPDSSDDEFDYLNPCTADLKKIFKLKSNIEVDIVSNKKIRHIGLYSSDIILPVIIGVSANVIAGVILFYVNRYLKDSDNVQCKVVFKDNKKGYDSVDFKGSCSDLKEILQEMTSDD
ncbi:hypothetical protein PVK62_16790 [Aliivibrio sp. S3MY1]|uniref:hypothetical protein n=1 Tax=unclassified Aliivibrio TaxID=2645654 RepID=UPI002379BEDA|nr:MULTISPECIES: hypothetical protein [unclassified Aliivibrio]MDD9197484.1 hypothetical protein [Aliivibrio sp. S3MY1]MDD9200735.1 hypothetical protein [Aliivibrio sp. S2MY1]